MPGHTYPAAEQILFFLVTVSEQKSTVQAGRHSGLVSLPEQSSVGCSAVGGTGSGVVAGDGDAGDGEGEGLGVPPAKNENTQSLTVDTLAHAYSIQRVRSTRCCSKVAGWMEASSQHAKSNSCILQCSTSMM